MTTGQLIKAARKSAGLTQKELGERLGVAYQTLAQWENDLRNPKYETICRIADALDVDFADLVPPEAEGKMIVDHVIGRLKALSSPIERATRDMKQMTEEGQNKVANYAEDILPRYRRQDGLQVVPAPCEDTDTTPPPEGTEGTQKDE